MRDHAPVRVPVHATLTVVRIMRLASHPFALSLSKGRSFFWR